MAFLFSVLVLKEKEFAFISVKRILILFCIIFFVGKNSIAQNPNIIWQKCYGGSGSESANAMIATSDGGYLIVGNTDSNDGDISFNHGGSEDVWLLKIDSNGVKDWEKSYGGSGSESVYSIIETEHKCYLIFGTTDSNDGDVSNNHGHNDLWLVKIDSVGTIIWGKTFGGSEYDDGEYFQQTLDNGFILVGATNSIDGDIGAGFGHGGGDCLILKVDSAGMIQWKKIIGGSESDFLTSICTTSDGGYAVFGNSRSDDFDIITNQGWSDYLIIKLDSTGTVERLKTYGGTSMDVAIQGSIIQKEDGGFLVSGSTASNNGNVSNNHGNYDFWILSLNNAGAIQWQKCFGGSNSDLPYSKILKTNAGNYALAGSTSSNDGQVNNLHMSTPECWLIFFNSSVDLLPTSAQCFGGNQGDFGSSVLQCANGDYLIAGGTGSDDGDVSGNHNSNTGDIWVFKLSQSVGIKEVNNGTTVTVYPNPAANQLTVESTKTINTIEITDAIGRVQSFKLKVQRPATQIDIHALASGIYFIKLYFGDGSFVVKKFIKE